VQNEDPALPILASWMQEYRRTVQEQSFSRSSRRMLEAAADLIVEVGYHKMTLAAIGAEQATVTVSRRAVRVQGGSAATVVEWSTRGGTTSHVFALGQDRIRVSDHSA